MLYISTLRQGPRLLQPLLFAVEIPDQLISNLALLRRVRPWRSTYLILKMLPTSRHPAMHSQVPNSIALTKGCTLKLQNNIRQVAERAYRGK